MNCDAQTLATAAQCLECNLPPGMANNLIIYLLCQIAGIQASPASLIVNSQCLNCNLSVGIQNNIIIYLLCQIASGQTGGNPSPVLNASVPTDMVTTYSGSAPVIWILQSSLNGTSGWTTADTNPSTPAHWIAETFGFFYRSVGQDGSGNNITPFSNVVSI